jgi:dopamine beta-monooxygenase
MEVFHCDAPADVSFPLWSGPCGADDAPPQLAKCKKVLAAWAIGAGPFQYPEVSKWAVTVTGREQEACFPL